MDKLLIFLSSLIITFVITVVILIKLIPYLRSIKIGQKILDIGPKWHKKKEGTPTMCGISFVIASLFSVILIILIFNSKLSLNDKLVIINVIAFSVLNGMIGIIDDIAKIRKSKNEGLTPKSKFLLQSIVAVLFLISLKFTVGIDTNIFIPFFNVNINLEFFYYILCYFIICGVVNSVNLTDGIDGLASSVALTVGLFLFFVSFTKLENVPLTVISSLIIGSTIGFLFFNLYPAKAFMGDAGSLFLGGLVVSSSFILNNPLLVLIYGFVFIVEALSDILQVSFFKLTKGKRIFKMAPIHHHFEKSGFSEMKIVMIFSITNILFCILAYFGLGNL